MTNLRLALRSLAKSPGFSVVAILTLALCIGANSAIFSVINAVLLKPFPFPDSERLVVVYNTYPGSGLEYAGVSIPDYFDRLERAPSIEDGAIYTYQSFNLATDRQPVRALGLVASPSLFSTLQVSAARGRVFTATEAEPGADGVVVLSHSFWRDTFGARENLLGETIRLGGEPYQVIGIMPEGFVFPAPEVKLWVPFQITPAQRTMDERGNEYSEMIARLKPGATAAGLSAECATIVQQNLEQVPEFRPYVESTGFTGIAQPLLDNTVEDIAPMLWLLQGGVIAALLIGCANVANLLLTRAVARERELAIRSALGATPGSIVRQLLTESLVLFVLGGTLGLLVATWSLAGMDALGVTSLPRGGTVELDHRVLLFTLTCAGLTGFGFGLIPALQASRPRASDALKSAGTRSTAGRRQRLMRNGLVIAEVALSVMLLATAALLMRSFHRLQQQSPGFNPESVLTARLTLPDALYPEDTDRIAFVDNVLRELQTIPGVVSVGATSNLPFGPGNSQGTYRIVGQDVPEGAAPPHGQIRSVSPDYFSALQIPLQRGRVFTALDRAETEQVVIIDRVLAERYWPGEDPIGKQIYRGSREATPENVRTIVGVVAAVKQLGLDDPIAKETIYYPFAQRPLTGLTLTIRTSLAPEGTIPAVRQAVLRVDPELPVYDVQPLTGRIETSLLNRRSPMLLLSLFAGMALLLAALGVYGVLAFSVGQRTQEIGIRMALGAAARNVLGLILGQGLRLIAVGVGIGVVGYLAISRLLSHLVFEISPADPLAITTAALGLILVAVVACLIPARRAARVDPMVALRDE